MNNNRPVTNHQIVNSPFLPAILMAAAVILTGPYIPDIRNAVARASAAWFVVVVATGIMAAIAVALLLAVTQIRERRVLRYGALATAILIGVTYATAVRTGNAEVDAVERFHFVEYGIVAVLFYRAWRHRGDASIVILPLLAGVLVATLDESLQWFVPSRVGEAHDIFIDGVAVICGVLFAMAVDPPRASALGTVSSKSAAQLSAFAAVVILAFALFFDAVHLGIDLTNPEIGTFRSRYSHDRLLSLSADRDRRWQAAPPLTSPRLSREDQYLSEGTWHVQRRNRAWDAGDAFVAWRENLILESFFAPVLDTPSLASRSGHRWQPEHRDEAARRASADRRPFTSDAVPYPLYGWPRPLFWSVMGLTLFSLAVGGVVWRRNSR